MDNETKRLVFLFERYIGNSASEAEVTEFLSLIDKPGNKTLAEELLGNTWDAMAAKQTHLQVASKVAVPFYKRKKILSIAASVLVIVCAASYFSAVMLAGKKKAALPVALSAKDVLPGGDKAVLTLSDGSTIVLNDAKNGSLAEQGNVDVVKLTNGKLAYRTGGAANTGGEILYNTITTPAGGQYQLTLSDGTMVKLNAASSIHFPAAFMGKERQVQVTGEAYFEVAKNAAMPFVVKVKDMNVRVLGTHFNIMAYDEEQVVKTTLLEGKVNVYNSTSEADIVPGQQAIAVEGKGDFKVKEADTDEEIAWISGFFQFEKADVKTIMRQLSRWYDIDVSYETTNDNRRFGGRISRNQNLSEVLHVLELNNLHFKTEGRKVVVLP